MATTLSWNRRSLNDVLEVIYYHHWTFDAPYVQNDTSSPKILELDEFRVKPVFCLIDGALDAAFEKVEDDG